MADYAYYQEQKTRMENRGRWGQQRGGSDMIPK